MIIPVMEWDRLNWWLEEITPTFKLDFPAEVAARIVGAFEEFEEIQKILDEAISAQVAANRNPA